MPVVCLVLQILAKNRGVCKFTYPPPEYGIAECLFPGVNWNGTLFGCGTNYAILMKNVGRGVP